mmetsp:Transcript_1707/g.4506  ORF Transcript_1707/g.4506 Transcript_1707/m.4506 type:complete len:220 (-) Transcript_1707:1495-2154(-)
METYSKCYAFLHTEILFVANSDHDAAAADRRSLSTFVLRAGCSRLLFNPGAEMAQPITQKLAPTKKCIPGTFGNMDNRNDDGASASSPPFEDTKEDANVDNSVAYIEEPIAPVNSVSEPTAPSRAPDSPGGARLASSACNAGIATQPKAMIAIERTKLAGVATNPALDKPIAYVTNPKLMERCKPRRGTMIRGTMASINPTMTSTGPDCAWVQPNRKFV